MNILPPALTNVINALGLLPGVGPRTAERYAYYLLKNNPQNANTIVSSLEKMHQNIDYCKITFALVQKGKDISDLYSNPSRNKKLIAVVAEPFDVVALENTGEYKGTYHVLGGLISPIDAIGPDDLHIPELIKRIKKDAVTEVILATNASVEGESTALYIQQELKNQNIQITRLARGLPVGVDLEYADLITLGRAISGRTSL